MRSLHAQRGEHRAAVGGVLLDRCAARRTGAAAVAPPVIPDQLIVPEVRLCGHGRELVGQHGSMNEHHGLTRSLDHDQRALKTTVAQGQVERRGLHDLQIFAHPRRWGLPVRRSSSLLHDRLLWVSSRNRLVCEMPRGLRLPREDLTGRHSAVMVHWTQ